MIDDLSLEYLLVFITIREYNWFLIIDFFSKKYFWEKYDEESPLKRRIIYYGRSWWREEEINEEKLRRHI